MGGVEIDLNKGAAAIVFVVFPTHADALADWRDAPRSGLTVIKTPSGLPSPALLGTGKTSSGYYALGAFVDRFVIAETAMHLRGKPGKSDLAALAAFTKGALQHLRSVEAKAG